MISLGVFIFGGLGALMRYALGAFYFSMLPPERLVIGNYFPWPTFLINILGSFAIGCFWSFSQRDMSMVFGIHTTIWMTGLIGGFTTFSAFSLETVRLIEQRQMGLAALYVMLSVGISVLATWAAISLSKS